MPERHGSETPVMIRGGTVIDAGGERRVDLAMVDGRIQALGEGLAVPAGATVLDAGGCIVAPGLVDLHAHLREPGQEEAETIETGTRAAALGGYTAVVAMPNTNPPLDSADAVRNVFELASTATAEVAVAGAITVGREGNHLAPMAELAALGVRLFTDDGAGVQSAGLMRRALEYGRGLGVTLAQHCEDGSLACDGAMHEGAWSSRLGLPGMPALAEEVMVARDIALARATGARIHFLHLSTGPSIELVRQAKAMGLPVTAEAAPHHFSLTDACAADYDPVFKVNPPLRPQADVDAVKAGLADGTLDAIATDHAPHAPEFKDLPFDLAPPGMLGLQTALGLAITELDLSLPRILALLSWQPAAIAGLDPAGGGGQGGPIEVGAEANLCVFDANATWTVDPMALASRSRNSPYGGRTLTGRVRHTVFRGEPVVVDGEATR
ncbi:MAG TPA: dihydroorotase [Acidimicrobiales bacterium]|jgi:dihydroorotase|nr:dihydroorotase [Acidimicrobiales bacterium]